jgi:carboxyl-terminal processing protease
MRKRVFVVAACAFLLGQALVVGMQWMSGRAFLPPTSSGRKAEAFQEVLSLVNSHYVREGDAGYDKLTKTALESMLRSLDPHSEYLAADEFRNFRVETSQQFGGIGVQIEMRDRRLTVVVPIGGSPGERAGLLRGDQIIAVDGRNIEGFALDECLGILRGPPGTPVALTVFRPRTGETLEKQVERDVIRVESVRDARMVAPGVGYVRVVQFGERTGAEFLDALVALEREGLTSLIIDLRDNPGGLLDAARAVADPFFEKDDLILYTQGRGKDTREDIRARGRTGARRYPLAVLINPGSASASEIVAGALRDTGRAVIVGEKSFGKGSVQTILQLPGGEEAIRLTTALYYLPSGMVINGRGIEPHIPVTLTPDEDRKLAIQRNRLSIMNAEEFEEQFEFAPIEDRQLTTAVDALKGVFALAASRARSSAGGTGGAAAAH